MFIYHMCSILVYVIAWLGVKFGINTMSIVVGVANLHEAKWSAICHFHYNTSGIYPKFHDQPCYHRLIPYSRAPAYLQVLEHAGFCCQAGGHSLGKLVLRGST